MTDPPTQGHLCIAGVISGYAQDPCWQQAGISWFIGLSARGSSETSRSRNQEAWGLFVAVCFQRLYLKFKDDQQPFALHQTPIKEGRKDGVQHLVATLEARGSVSRTINQ